MEWNSKTIWLLVWLILWTWWDWKHWVISLRQGLFVLAAGLVWQLADNCLWTGSVMGGVLLGGAAWGVSLFSRDQFGRGDALVILCLGVYLGFSCSLSVMMWALVLASVVSLYLLVIRKCSGKQAIPFIPCLTAGYGIMLLLGTVGRG